MFDLLFSDLKPLFTSSSSFLSLKPSSSSLFFSKKLNSFHISQASMKRTKKMAFKRREDASSSSESHEVITLDNFRDEATYNRFLADPNHQVLTGISLDSYHLDSPSFEHIYKYFYRKQDWDYFLSYNDKYEPSMIRQFFVNLRIVSSTCVESIVYGNLISFSPQDLCKHFGVSESGAKITSGNFERYSLNYNHLDALKSLLDPSCTNFASTSVADLSIENRMLHHIVTRTITPRAGSYSAATPFDIGIMFLIRKNASFNLPYLMFYHICHCASIPKSAYPYGMHLTRFLVDYMKIPSIPGNVVTPDPRLSKYSHGSISLLFRYDDDTSIWHRKFKVSSTTPQVPPVDFTAAAPSAPPFSADPSSSSGPNPGDDRLDRILSSIGGLGNRFDNLEHQFTSLTTEVRTRFDRVDTRFNTVDEQIANLILAQQQQQGDQFPTGFFDMP